MEVGHCLGELVRLPLGQVRAEGVEVLQVPVQWTILYGEAAAILANSKGVGGGERSSRRHVYEKIFNRKWTAEALYLITVLVLFLELKEEDRSI